MPYFKYADKGNKKADNYLVRIVKIIFRRIISDSFILLQCFIDNPLNLSVDGTEFVGSPFLDGFHRLGIETQSEILGRIFLIFRHYPKPPLSF